MPEIHLANGIVCVGSARFRCAFKPIYCPLAVYGRSRAVAIHDAELELSLGLALLGGPGQPVDGSDVVARNTFSSRVDETKLHLRDGVSSIRQRRKHLDGALIIMHGISNKRVGQFVGCRSLIE